MGMSIDIEIQTTLTPEDDKHLMGWSEQVFPIEGKPISWAPLAYHIVARDGDEAVGHIGFGEFTLEFGDERLSVIGVGCVVVRPEYQGQGLPSAMFAKLHASQLALNLSPEFTLFCPQRLVSYYERHGYVLYQGDYTFMQSEKQVGSTFCFMHRGPSTLGDKITIPSNPW